MDAVSNAVEVKTKIITSGAVTWWGGFSLFVSQHADMLTFLVGLSGLCVALYFHRKNLKINEIRLQMQTKEYREQIKQEILKGLYDE
jgi:hypothetical protein